LRIPRETNLSTTAKNANLFLIFLYDELISLRTCPEDKNYIHSQIVHFYRLILFEEHKVSEEITLSIINKITFNPYA